MARWRQSSFQDQLAATRSMFVCKLKKQNATQCHMQHVSYYANIMWWYSNANRGQTVGQYWSWFFGHFKYGALRKIGYLPPHCLIVAFSQMIPALDAHSTMPLQVLFLWQQPAATISNFWKVALHGWHDILKIKKETSREWLPESDIQKVAWWCWRSYNKKWKEKASHMKKMKMNPATGKEKRKTTINQKRTSREWLPESFIHGIDCGIM